MKDRPLSNVIQLQQQGPTYQSFIGNFLQNADQSSSSRSRFRDKTETGTDKANPLIGYPAVLHRDDAIHQAQEIGRNMISWGSVKMDRFDVRGLIDPINPPRSSPPLKRRKLEDPPKSALEVALNNERYRDLLTLQGLYGSLIQLPFLF